MPVCAPAHPHLQLLCCAVLMLVLPLVLVMQEEVALGHLQLPPLAAAVALLVLLMPVVCASVHPHLQLLCYAVLVVLVFLQEVLVVGQTVVTVVAHLAPMAVMLALANLGMLVMVHLQKVLLEILVMVIHLQIDLLEILVMVHQVG